MSSAATVSSLSYRAARLDDAPAIVALVNSGYRGEGSKQGWTTEADLLEGTRTTEDEVRPLIQAKDSIVLLCERGSELIGSVHLQRKGDSGYLGMLVVRPTLQGAGIGKQFMQAAEQTIREKWDVRRITMTVISVRDELIAFYERRGYRRTGVFEPFPIEGSGSTYRVGELKFEVLEKVL